MTKQTLTTGVAASALMGGFAAMILSFLWAASWLGYTLSVLWGWFVVPAFGLPALSVAQAYGLTLVVRAAHGIKDVDGNENKGLGLALLKLVLIPPAVCSLFLLSGWVAKSWV